MWAVSIPAAVQEDFLYEFGWDKLVAQMPERPGMRDAWNAVEFAVPKGNGKHMNMRVHPALGVVLRQMLELRWADMFQVSNEELEPAYYHIIEDLKNRTAAEAKTRRRK